MEISKYINYFLLEKKEKLIRENISDYLAQIQTKADARIISSLSRRLGVSETPLDREESIKYWEAVRDILKQELDKLDKFR